MLKSHALRLAALEIISADENGQDQIMHEEAVRLHPARLLRIAARGEQPQIDIGVFNALLCHAFARDEIAHQLDMIGIELRLFCRAQCKARRGSREASARAAASRAISGGSNEPASPEPSCRSRHVSTKFCKAGMAMKSRSRPLPLEAVSSMTPANCAEAKRGRSARSGAEIGKEHRDHAHARGDRRQGFDAGVEDPPRERSRS